MRCSSLRDWLRWQEGLHPRTIELGLERVAAVAKRLGVDRSGARVITVGGTNGKGSTVAYLEAMLRALGYHPGVYSSPHVQRYNERIRIDGREATDEAIVAAFEAVDEARSDTPLTYFEFGTLAALHLFQLTQCDVWLLEVGMGGRLDAVNILAADVAVLTNVELDHTDWLGHDRDSIGREKAGIMRPGRPVIFGSVAMPCTVTAHARCLGSDARRLGRDFDYGSPVGVPHWWWRGRSVHLSELPLPGLSGCHQLANAAAALAALEAFGEPAARLADAARRALPRVYLPGRAQWLAGPPDWLLDVAHNAAAAARLPALLRARSGSGRVRCIFGLLRRKDLAGVVAPLLPLVDQWYLLQLADGEALAAAHVAAHLRANEARIAAIGPAHELVSRVCGEAETVDCIVAFGSFRVVAEILHELRLSDPLR
ncbi:bifunctional tetrahydrofolate synthase/dihydrofolate synthase [Nitrococcus mobilis]|uniref:Dihydrofolate synthase/folylpolyglutamate synthase n=1 Tax=Nitrococcus mobilis Nb-231 TaxID=314278 RepID=A4BRV9_9GAMM|nr:bifunctional tetrahydrofolate synthase/dihydrofolate synthase [Nitrococcus mobilis]EAR21438.1 folylpolyglutamate synthase/dihydrofolate synthase [Nitrococcus mobilis Nb-231]